MLRNRSRPALRSEVGETEAGGGWTTAWSAAAQGSSSQALHVVLPPWRLLNKCGCPGLLPLTATPPEVAWVTRYQVLRLRDAGGGRGAERGPLWSGTSMLAGTGEGLAGACSAKAASRTVSIPSPQLVTWGQKEVSGCSSAEPPKNRLASAKRQGTSSGLSETGCVISGDHSPARPRAMRRGGAARQEQHPLILVRSFISTGLNSAIARSSFCIYVAFLEPVFHSEAKMAFWTTRVRDEAWPQSGP
ncbi:unnamed protein product [Rangifer tarandus platyrhynchus]|uniref:Uncharacterized protein n=2 Tax=Rangifer tarandus platyrhynchus TaxID=3082113 RepID=A0ACB0EEQ9_RANTA|nr:unnamed protein product [Rangifer tarandus platyrhynchus]CAI9698761.1 unnamed protein product [Rangifer tarandus platyrhynchus]